ncbi:MAG TPA: hypothetical protein VGJ20_45055, partial [Xanthobacteraceae bacterium]
NAVMGFNDAHGRPFKDILAVIHEARELALVDAYVEAMEEGAPTVASASNLRAGSLLAAP